MPWHATAGRRAKPFDDEAPERAERAAAPAASRITPATRSGSQYGSGSRTSQPVSSHGISPATTPGASTRNTRLPSAALARLETTMPDGVADRIELPVRPRVTLRSEAGSRTRSPCPPSTRARCARPSARRARCRCRARARFRRCPSSCSDPAGRTSRRSGSARRRGCPCPRRRPGTPLLRSRPPGRARPGRRRAST